jgi:CelD/BcsL family acetyltransferase involved in cellulose biosynthesis
MGMTVDETMHIEPVSPDREEAYEALLANAPEATFYHTRRWARIVTRAFPQIVDRSCIVTDGEQRHALPLYIWRRAGGLLTTAHSSFPFLYGGPIPSTPAAWQAVRRHLRHRGSSALLIGNPFGACAPAADAPHFTLGEEHTHLLALPETVEAFWSDVLTSRKRNDIRRLTRKGVDVQLAGQPDDLDAFYDLYLKRMQTWEKRPGFVYPLAFYRAMREHGGDAVRLYIVRFEDRVIGGTLVCRWNGIAHYQAGYFDHDARNLRPNVLAQERIIRDAIEDGCRIYDMLPSGGIAPVEAFKESFGSVKTAFPRWQRRGMLQRIANRAAASWWRLRGASGRSGR